MKVGQAFGYEQGVPLGERIDEIRQGPRLLTGGIEYVGDHLVTMLGLQGVQPYLLQRLVPLVDVSDKLRQGMA